MTNGIPHPHAKPVRLTFFWIGIVSTLLYRLIIVLDHVAGPWVKIAWYVGTVGFIFYFAHRFDITQRRARLIEERDLLGRIQKSNLPADDQSALAYALGTLRSSTEKWIYYTIFVSSILGILVGAYLDFFV